MPQQVSDWYEKWSEPVRLRSRHAALDHFNRNATGWINSTSQLLRGWYSPLSEPVRRKAPLPQGAVPHFVLGINYVQFRLAATEQGDIASFVFASYQRRRLADTTVREIVPSMCSVTITEQGPDRA